MKIEVILPFVLPLIFSGLSRSEFTNSTNHSNATIERDLQKRGRSRFTFFTPGLGACGKYNKSRDPIVALNSKQWDGGAHCFKWVNIRFGHKQVKAQITDECPGCPYGGLDLSPSVFSTLAILDLGVLYGDWNYLSVDESSSEQKDKVHHATPSSTRKTITSTATVVTVQAQAAHQTLEKQPTSLTPASDAPIIDAATTTVNLGDLYNPYDDDSLYPRPNPTVASEAGSVELGRPFGDPLYEFGDALHLSDAIQARPHHVLETALVARPTQPVVVPLNHDQATGNIAKLNVAALHLGRFAVNALFTQVRAAIHNRTLEHDI